MRHCHCFVTINTIELDDRRVTTDPQMPCLSEKDLRQRVTILCDEELPNQQVISLTSIKVLDIFSYLIVFAGDRVT